eukprot:CAMPEP_0176004154 /NCGR_PEP_ID=MMETSP0120_2-20121206/1544_1 /TAXON_ID=160619 /ORGANISM="Kryptoperidinium foliaceum, Strain CCMP 1326" /LENGTH=140 /DNA_ID=CAMNT_0017336821 /DNA_START=83 /DNA_END=505 /DNA_ORIENTATION=+
MSGQEDRTLTEPQVEEQDEMKARPSDTMNIGDDHDDNSSSSSAPWCPLFMEGLPSNFNANPHLAAIASLLDDDGEAAKDNKEHFAEKRSAATRRTQAGGGKARRRDTRRSAAFSPYRVPEKTKPRASVGEAQLFLKMWKL